MLDFRLEENGASPAHLAGWWDRSRLPFWEQALRGFATMNSIGSSCQAALTTERRIVNRKKDFQVVTVSFVGLYTMKICGELSWMPCLLVELARPYENDRLVSKSSAFSVMHVAYLISASRLVMSLPTIRIWTLGFLAVLKNKFWSRQNPKKIKRKSGCLERSWLHGYKKLGNNVRWCHGGHSHKYHFDDFHSFSRYF